jgi:4-amino-4-deoxy-L-arabinose transferase-like glycosyltransferase
MRSRLSKHLLIGILVLALGARLAVAIMTASWVFPSDKNFWKFGYENGQIAASLAMGNGFSWPEWSNYPLGATSWMAPIYPLIMAATFEIFGIFSRQAAMALILFLSIVSALSCVLLYFIGERLYNAQVGFLAAFLLAIYPPSINYAVRNLWDTTLFTCCLLLIILMFLKLVNRSDIKGSFWLGMMLGFTALINPIVVIAIPFTFVGLFLNSNITRGAIIKRLSLTIIAFCLVISPWLVRNYLVFGQFTFIKSNFGYELYKGMNDETRDNEEHLVSRTHISRVFTESERQFLEQSDEATRNRFLLQKGVNFILEHPLLYIEQTIVRFFRFWTYMKPIDRWEANISLILFLILLTLSIIGLIISKMNRRDVQLVLLFLLALPLPYYFTLVRAFRYRFPIEPILIVFAAYTVYRVIAASYQSKELLQGNWPLVFRSLKGKPIPTDPNIGI